jgi:putative transcriptional regulator
LAVLLLLSAFDVAARPRLGDPTALAKGKLLVAHRGLHDPNFSRTVILLVRFGERGTSGFVINRPTPVALSEMEPGLEGQDEGQSFVFDGGPVARGVLQALVRSDTTPPEAIPVLDGIYYGKDPLLVQWLFGEGRAKASFRTYAGYAGWAPGQLESEVSRGDWYVVSADAEMLFDAEPETLWRRLIPRDPSRAAELTEPHGSIGDAAAGSSVAAP